MVQRAIVNDKFPKPDKYAPSPMFSEGQMNQLQSETISRHGDPRQFKGNQFEKRHAKHVSLGGASYADDERSGISSDNRFTPDESSFLE